MIIGLDEAGRGALAGPVVAGAVCLGETEVPALVKDSKKLTDAQRCEAYAWIKASTHWGVGLVEAAEIDAVGIKRATEKAMNLALQQLITKNPPADMNISGGDIHLLVDGRDRFQFPMPSQDIIKGDEKVPEISAASIIAKVTRDCYMVDLDVQYPDFGFAAHKGYGAAQHYALLEQGRHCEEHRRTYDPLKTWLNQGRLF